MSSVAAGGGGGPDAGGGSPNSRGIWNKHGLTKSEEVRFVLNSYYLNRLNVSIERKQ